jgi:hypothetical protein
MLYSEVLLCILHFRILAQCDLSMCPVRDLPSVSLSVYRSSHFLKILAQLTQTSHRPMSWSDGAHRSKFAIAISKHTLSTNFYKFFRL